MSIPLGKRSKSGVEYFDFAYRLCDDITRLLIRDFGIKRVSKELKTFTYAAKMEVHDRETFIDLCNKYGIEENTHCAADKAAYLFENTAYHKAANRQDNPSPCQ